MRRLLAIVVLCGASTAQDYAELVRQYVRRDGNAYIQTSLQLNFEAKPAAPYFVRAWATDDKFAIHRIGEFLWDRRLEALVALHDGLKAADPRIRVRCAALLARDHGPEDDPLDPRVVPILVGAIDVSDESLQHAAILELSKLGVEAERVILVLLKLLVSSAKGLPNRARFAFEKYGEKAAAAIPALAELTRGQNQIWASEAVRSLSHLGPRAFPHIFKTLKRPEPDVSYWSVIALGTNGGHAKGAIDRLVAMARRYKSDADKEALEALAQIDPSDARVQALMNAELFGDHGVRAFRAQALVTDPDRGHFFPEQNKALLKDEAIHTRLTAAAILARAGEARYETLAAMLVIVRGRGLLNDAIAVIGQLGPMAADALPELCERVGRRFDHRAKLKRCAADIGVAALPALKQALRKPDKHTRFAALICLHGFGPLARPLRADVAKLEGDSDLGVAAKAVLQSIDGEKINQRSDRLSLDALGHEDAELRREAVGRLQSFDRSSPFAPVIRKQLERAARADADERVRAGAIMALSYVAKLEQMIPLIRSALRAQDKDALSVVLTVAKRYKAKAKPLQPDIEALLGNVHASVMEVIWCLDRILGSERLLERLLERLAKGSEQERSRIVSAVSLWSPVGRTDTMRQRIFSLLLDDPSEDVRRAAWDALWRVGSPKTGLPRILEALRAKKEPQYTGAILGAGGYPEAHAQLAPLLMPLLDDPIRQIDALSVFFRWGVQAKYLLPRLKQLRATAKGDFKKGLDEVIKKAEG